MATGDKFYLGGQRPMNQYYSFNSSVSGQTAHLGFEASVIKYISNDDDTNDLIITFNDVLTTSPAGLNGAIVLKPGEVINDLNVKATKINMKRPAGGGFVRFLAGV